MGIKYLNTYLLQNCKNKSIRRGVNISFLKNKTIAIDTHIYLYKFTENGTLLQNMREMILLFLSYNIKPIFVFDGKPPAEKQNTLLQRKKNKKEAEEQYYQLQEKIKNSTIITTTTTTTTTNENIELQNLKKQFVRINETDIKNVKLLMDELNVCHIEAPNEADSLCVYLVKMHVAWACLSDDMDMFVYGSYKVIRNFDIRSQTVWLYDLNNILRDLSCSMKEFREILVLSGTDYNSSLNHCSLLETLKLFRCYKKTNNEKEFYVWLKDNTTYIQDYENLIKIHSLFLLENHSNLIRFKKFKEHKQKNRRLLF